VNANNSGLEVWGLYRMDADGKPVAAVDADGEPIAGQQAKVDMASGQYNLMAREFWNQGPNAAANQDNQNKRIYSSSDAVVHLIDGALFFSPDQMQDWETVVNAQINQ
jgi:thymidine kinase